MCPGSIERTLNMAVPTIQSATAGGLVPRTFAYGVSLTDSPTTAQLSARTIDQAARPVCRDASRTPRSRLDGIPPPVGLAVTCLRDPPDPRREHRHQVPRKRWRR